MLPSRHLALNRIMKGRDGEKAAAFMWASIRWEWRAGNTAVIMLCLLYIPSAGVTPLKRRAGFF